MQLCELSLQATGLTHKKGAEILPDVFEQVKLNILLHNVYKLKKCERSGLPPFLGKVLLSG